MDSNEVRGYEISEQGETELSYEQTAVKFCKGLDNQVIYNSDEVPVAVRLTSGELLRTTHQDTEDDVPESGYETDIKFNAPKVGGENGSNYVTLFFPDGKKEIKIHFARLTGVALVHKNIYPQLIKLISENIPKEYKLVSKIAQRQTRERIASSEAAYISAGPDFKAESLAKLKQTITESYLVRIRTAVGYNKFTVKFLPPNSDMAGPTEMELVAEKVEGQSELEVDIIGL